jgi:hypothetical protein
MYNDVYSWYLYFSGGGYSVVTYNNKDYGYPARCVRD